VLRHPGRWFLAIVASLLVLDQVTKALIVASFAHGEVMPITSFMSLVLAYNSGAAFSFLAGAGGWQRHGRERRTLRRHGHDFGAPRGRG